VPLAILLIAARAVTRGRENARRLQVLFDAAARVQTMHNVAEVLQALTDEARELLRVRTVEVRDEPPGEHEVGARFADGHGEQWIIAQAGNPARSSMDADQQALDALVAVAVEAFARLRLTTEMTHMAHHDVLTGLPNRALFLDRAEHALLMARRRGTRLAVLYCDLDGFKRVNDRFGHAAGDTLLIEVASRVTRALRETDTVARFGGDEFAVLLEDIEGENQVEFVCERLLAVLRERILVADHFVSVTTSIGVAYSDSTESADGLLRNADMAMYEAKRRGKDRWQKYEVALGRARVQRLEMVEALRNAVDGGHLGVAYQPVVEVRTGRVVGVEALARWSLDGEPVPPDVFIGAAEESGLVVALGEVVLDAVAADAPSLRSAAGQRLTLGVNVSAQQLRSPTFIGRVEAAQSKIGDLELLLEITERDFVANDAASLDMMSRLARRGVRFAVDDFGVGFSSIGYLQQLPVHILKTDRSFTAGIDEDERACKLLRSMVVMGEALGLRVIVEGVERQTQVDHLIRHVGAPMAQGYLLQRPVRLAELLEILSSEAPATPQQVASLAARLI
jgi:diguanylate cyclase (GGDEF)-like protein